MCCQFTNRVIPFLSNSTLKFINPLCEILIFYWGALLVPVGCLFVHAGAAK